MKICYMCHNNIISFNNYGRIERYICNHEVCDVCYSEVNQFLHEQRSIKQLSKTNSNQPNTAIAKTLL